ncbi:MAG: hypothetical protein JXB49_29270 [Bacteroidales bacterium]|nr:hypothetical protein [Bacteroidales bacterium]
MRIYFVFLVLIIFGSKVVGQFAGPSMLYTSPEVDKSRGEDYGYVKYGIIPFSGREQMRLVYNGEVDGVSNAMEELQFTSISLSVDTMRSNSIYVELISFVPSASFGRFSFGSQITQADIEADSNSSYQSIATQKLMNGGGNMNLNLSRPILYAPLSQRHTSYLITNAALTCYMDVKRLNSKLYNPGFGSQLNLDFDLRLFSNRSEIMIGNLYRGGLKGRYLYNAFDSKYKRENDIDDSLDNLSILSLSFYMGLGPVFFELGYNFSNSDIIANSKNLFRVSLQPVKY